MMDEMGMQTRRVLQKDKAGEEKSQRGSKLEKDKVRIRSNKKRAGKENDDEKTNDYKTAQKSNQRRFMCSHDSDR